MNWIDIKDEEPPRNEMIIVDTDKGIAIAQYDGFGKVSHCKFGFVGITDRDHFEVLRWQPMPQK
jgi:hypothetical protein